MVDSTADSDRVQRSRPLAELVYERLEERIIDGTFAPGEHLREEDLAERFGVSRNPVRESLSALERAGWVEIRAGRGAYVRQPTVDEVLDFFHVRTVLEAESARLAARHATASRVRELQELIVAGRAAIDSGESETLVDLNRQFHTIVHVLAGNQVLRETLGQLDRQLRWYFHPIVVGRAPQSWREHEQLAASFADNDEDRAAEIMRAHVQATTEAYRAARSGDDPG